jgi:hypothetical protein
LNVTVHGRALASFRGATVDFLGKPVAFERARLRGAQFGLSAITELCAKIDGKLR